MDPALALELEHVSRHKALEREALRGVSDIRGFYSGSTALVTGGTGFIGKQLVEKLLRSCDVKRIYILMRKKKETSILERLHKQFKDPLYDSLRVEDPGFESKVLPIEGDIGELGIGISFEDERKIIEEVNFIFHVAATTRFQERLKKATFVNIRGTREMLNLAKSCKNLRSFVHVSTAFSFATRSRIDGDIEEQFYSSPVPPHVIIQLAETVDEERLNDITQGLIKDWPNTYCFTKAIAEDLVRTLGSDLPVTVVRPPVVICTYNEPTPGWIDKSSVLGPSGMLLGVILGVTHVMLHSNIKLNFMPLDYVNNAIVVAAREANIRCIKEDKEITVYNISALRNRIRFKKFSNVLRSSGCRRYSTPKAVWYCFGFETSSEFAFWLSTWVFHYTFAYVLDFVFNLTGMKRPEGIKSFIKLYEKIYNTSLIYGYFAKNDWKFIDNNVAAMFDKLSKTDKVLFNFDIKTIVWTQLVIIWCMGLRKFVIKDGMRGTDYGVKKQKWLKLANVVLYTVFLGIVAYFIYLCYVIVKFLF